MDSPEQSASEILIRATVSERDTTEQSNSSQEPQPSTSSAIPQASLSSEIQEKLQELEKSLKGKHAENIILQENLQHSEERAKKFETALLKCLTVRQAQCLVSGKPSVQWQEADVINALALKSLSLKTYRYLRNHMAIPLPSESTVNRWVAGINVEPGILNSVLRMMTQHSQSLSPGQRACTICFDEMKIDSKYCYDRGADKIYKPHTNVQVVLAQGIMYNWVQPLFYNYDTRMTKELLLDIIVRTENAGFPVHGIVCDMGGANQGLLKKMQINMSCTNFSNPCHPERQVHVFADPPHLLKLVRNNILDHGILTPFGFANSEPLYEVVRYQKGDFKLTPKVSEANLCVKGPQRQKVKTAAHLLSETVAKSIHYLANKGILKSKVWEPTYTLIDLVDKWFDIMNSSTEKGHKTSAAAFVSSPEQVQLLKLVIHVFKNSKVSGKVYPFQTGIVISTQSLINLFEDMSTMYSLRYLLTRRLNQDSLENAFGILRQMGSAYDHPDPVSFKYRMRQYILSRKHVLVSLNPNTVSFKNESFVVEGIKKFKACSSPVKKQVNVDSDYAVEPIDDVIDVNVRQENNENLDPDSDDFKVPAEETDGFTFALGYVTHKFKDKYPFLCSHEKANDWVSCKDRGGLQHMHSNFLKSFSSLESLFRNRHKDGLLLEESNALQTLTQLAIHVKDIPASVVRFYFRVRIHFRVKVLNQTLRVEKSRKKTKKMRKIVY